MTASLVSLFRPREGWTNDERAQFARIERLLEDAGFAVDVEHGLSDEGEPWCVFCSRVTGDVIIHVACLDNRFMFDSTTLPRPIEGASFQRCAERFFEDVSLPMPLADRRNRVMLHPSAMLASLFITILLYAQATTEQPLFDMTPVDVDQDDPDGVPSETPLALRIKAIAQQVQEFVSNPETQAQQQAQQAYVNPGMATIPAGMALAVIAIAQDLAHAGEAGLLEASEEPTIASLLRAATATEVIAAPQGEQREAVSDAEPAEAVDAAAIEGSTLAEAEVAEDIDFAEMVEAALGAASAGLSKLADSAQSVLADFSEGIGSLGDVSALARVDDTALSNGDGLSLDQEGTPPLSTMVAMMLDATGLERATEVAFELAGRVWEIEIVDIAAETIRAIELAAFTDTTADTIELAVIEDDGMPVRGFDSGTGWQPGRVDPKPDASATRDDRQDHDLGRTEPSEPAPAEPLSPRDAVATILAEDRIVTESELDILLSAFAEQVGDLGMARGRDSIFFVDRSVTDHVQSRDIEATTVWLEDDTRVTFVGTTWDFDGFAA